MLGFASLVSAPLTLGSAVWLKGARTLLDSSITRRTIRFAGIWPLLDHYYEPLFDPERLSATYDEPRTLPGIDLAMEKQQALIDSFVYEEELAAFPKYLGGGLGFYFANEMFSGADAGFYYSLLRQRRPRRIVEIGCGFSTRLAVAALQRNQLEIADYACSMTCVEPYENLWLEELPVRVIRERVEGVKQSLFEELEDNDVLFIDSSHVIRPGGDVDFEVLQVLPTLRKGVLVHVHDIFTPWNYPRSWLEGGRLWNEQAMLEAFLTMNASFRIVAALAHLNRTHQGLLRRKFPGMEFDVSIGPSSFWIERV